MRNCFRPCKKSCLRRSWRQIWKWASHFWFLCHYLLTYQSCRKDWNLWKLWTNARFIFWYCILHSSLWSSPGQQLALHSRGPTSTRRVSLLALRGGGSTGKSVALFKALPRALFQRLWDPTPHPEPCSARLRFLFSGWRSAAGWIRPTRESCSEDSAIQCPRLPSIFHPDTLPLSADKAVEFFLKGCSRQLLPADRKWQQRWHPLSPRCPEPWMPSMPPLFSNL